MTDRPFWDRGDDDDVKPVGDKTEGVRIIGAEEAAEALERGDVAPRRGEGELKYGDRPAPPPEDAPRPAMRFPLPTDEGPADLSRPRATSTPPPAGPPAEMPHWADPPTGEVPRILPEDPDAGSGDDLDAWSTFATSGPRWRDQGSDWAEPDYDPQGLVHDDETRVGSLDDSDRAGPDDFFGFDDEPVEVGEASAVEVEAPPAPGPRPRRSAVRPRPGTMAPPAQGRDMQSAVVTGVGFVAAALILFALGPGWAMILVTGVVVVAAAELFGALQRGGYQPATLLGLVATAGLVLGAHWKGETAIPLVMGLATVFSLLWFLVGVTRVQPTMNAGVTILGIAQVGLLGSFAALILTMPNGIGILWGVIIAVVANDVGALFFGKQLGRAPLAPSISPNKTIEGTVGGAVASVIVPVLLLGMILDVHPWDTGSLAALGVVVAVVAPLGDLSISMMKRDLGIKDMGSILPGHGGILDRFDALLFALPAAYYLTRLLDIF